MTSAIILWWQSESKILTKWCWGTLLNEENICLRAGHPPNYNLTKDPQKSVATYWGPPSVYASIKLRSHPPEIKNNMANYKIHSFGESKAFCGCFPLFWLNTSSTKAFSERKYCWIVGCSNLAALVPLPPLKCPLVSSSWSKKWLSLATIWVGPRNLVFNISHTFRFYFKKEKSIKKEGCKTLGSDPGK